MVPVTTRNLSKKNGCVRHKNIIKRLIKELFALFHGDSKYGDPLGKTWALF